MGLDDVTFMLSSSQAGVMWFSNHCGRELNVDLKRIDIEFDVLLLGTRQMPLDNAFGLHSPHM